jgi:hypothetical protein
VLDLRKPTTIESVKLEMLSPTELALSGTLTTFTAFEGLDKFLRALDAWVVRERHRNFSADVRALTFVNSSALRLFVNWITWAERAHYRLIFLTDGSNPWQRVSFSALQSLAPAHVEIVERAAPAAF